MLGLHIGIIAFLSLLLTAVLILLVINFVASKYLRKFGKASFDNEEQFGFLADEGEAEEGEKEKEVFTELTQREVVRHMSQLNEEVSKHAVVHLSLQYVLEKRVVQGIIRHVTRLDLAVKSAPAEISFHVKIMPKKRFSRKTKWKDAQEKTLAVSFTMGPIAQESLAKSTLCCRLYGRRTTLGPKRRYGEFYIELELLSNVVNKNIDYTQRLTPFGKNAANYLKENDLPENVFSTDESDADILDDLPASEMDISKDQSLKDDQTEKGCENFDEDGAQKDNNSQASHVNGRTIDEPLFITED